MSAQRGENIESFKERLMLQRKKLVIIAVSFFSLLIVLTGFYLYNQKKLSDSKELETEAYQYYLGRLKDSNLTAEQRFTKSAELFLEANKKNKNISYLLNAGYAYDQAGKHDKAIETLNKVFELNDERFSNLAKIKISMIYLRNNEKENAVKSLNQVINSNSETMKDFAILQLAKIQERENKEEALKLYEMLKSKYPQSPFAEEAKRLIEQNKRG